MNESAQALSAFTSYRDMGSERSTAKVAQQCSKHKSLIDRWSGQHNWVERARQHDEAIAAEAAVRDKAARLADIDRKRQDRIKVAAVARGTAYKAFPHMTPQFLATRPDSVVRMLTYADALERLDMGEVTERIDVTVIREMTDEQIEAEIAARLAGAGGR